MNVKDGYTAMDDSIPKRPGESLKKALGDLKDGIKKKYAKSRKKKAAKKSAKKA